MLKWLKLSQHHHSGRLRPHEHTSYISLFILLAIVAFPLTTYTTFAATPYDGPESSSISVTGVMPGKPPTVAATIDLPTDKYHTGTSPVNVTGTCPKNTIVVIFKSDIFAGSTTCSDAGVYSIDIDLLFGQNDLVAKVYDALDQSGPDSGIITVFYDVLPSQAQGISSLNSGNAQLLLNTSSVFRGVFPGHELSVPIDILGGTRPYAVNVQWGDSTNKVIPRDSNVSFSAGHTYSKPGTYQISLQASDGAGRVAFLTIAAIVNGQTGAASTTAAISSGIASQLLVLWPAYVGAIAVVVSFWLGEKREKRILRAHGLLLPTAKI